MTDKSFDAPEAVPDADQQRLLKELNDSGFGFQHAVAQAIESRSGSGGWTVEYSEFPVSTALRPVHIDVLAWFENRLLLVGECKRVNPAFSDWLFARSPFTGWQRPDGSIDRIYDIGQSRVRSEPFRVPRATPFHIALEVKTKAPGDPSGKGRSLRDAINQVEAGVSGMMGTLAEHPHFWANAKTVYFLPVIFTTARLFTTDVDLGASDINTGSLPPNAKVQEARWLWLEDNVSPDLLNPVPLAKPSISSVASLGIQRHARMIAIVSRDAVDTFLREIANTFHYL